MFDYGWTEKEESIFQLNLWEINLWERLSQKTTFGKGCAKKQPLG
jgi:hypothetical protein